MNCCINCLTRFTLKALTQYLKEAWLRAAQSGSPSYRQAVPPASGSQFPKPKIPSPRSQAKDPKPKIPSESSQTNFLTPNSQAKVLQNESSQAEVSKPNKAPKRKFRSESSKAKVPTLKFPNEGSQTKVTKRKFSRESPQAKDPKQQMQIESFRAEDPKRSSQAKDPERKFPSERS